MTDVKHILRRFKNKKEKEKLQSEPPSTALPTPKVASKVPEVTETMPGDARPVHRTVTQAAVETAGEAMPATGDSPDSAQEKINRMNRLLKAAQKYVSDAPAKPAKEVGIGSAPPPAAGSVPCRIVQTEVMPSREDTASMPYRALQTEVMPLREDGPVQTEVMLSREHGPVHTMVTQIESPVVKTRVRPGRPIAARRPIAAKPAPASDVEVLSQNDAPCDRSYKTGVTAWEAPVSKPLPDATPEVLSPTSVEMPKHTAMDPSAVRAFAMDLAQEQIEEIAFLFSQCIGDPFDKERSWPDAAFAEARLSTQVKATSLMGDTAFNGALDMLGSDDPRNLQGAVYTLTAAFGAEAMPHVQRRLTAAAGRLIPSLITAMMHTPYTHTTRDLVPMFSNERPEIRAASMTVAAFRGDLKGEQVWAAVRAEPDPVLVSILADDLIKLPPSQCLSVRQRLFRSEVSTAKQAAVISMLKAGEIDGARCLNAALKEDTPPEPWMLEYLALSGGKQAADLIEKWCTEAACRCSALRAVGRLGNVQVIGTLLEALKNDEDETRAAAAEALERITGAGLKEEAAWEDWWNARHAELSPDCFYRYGEPFHFGRCIDEIACESTPALDRIAAHLELVIRGGAATPLNVDWPVERQKQAMGLLEEWWKENENRFTEGSWYFAGRSIV